MGDFARLSVVFADGAWERPLAGVAGRHTIEDGPTEGLSDGQRSRRDSRVPRGMVRLAHAPRRPAYVDRVVRGLRTLAHSRRDR